MFYSLIDTPIFDTLLYSLTVLLFDTTTATPDCIRFTVNPLGQPDCNGHSTAFDGIAYRPSDGGSRDTLIIEAGEREGIYMADFPYAKSGSTEAVKYTATLTVILANIIYWCLKISRSRSYGIIIENDGMSQFTFIIVRVKEIKIRGITSY